MKQKVLGAVRTSALVITMAIPFAAQAQTPAESTPQTQMQVASAPQAPWYGAYLGTNIGSADQKVSVDGAGSRKDSDTGYKLYGGVGINQHFGVETGYVNFGEGSVRNSLSGASASAKPHAVYVAATGTLPLNEQVSLFAKAGVAANRTKIRTTFAGVSDSDTESRIAPMIGVGAAYKFTPNVSVVGEYENFGKIVKEDGASLKADMVSVGLRYQFH